MRQHVRLQHVRKGGNMSGCHMLEKAAICLAAACFKMRQHVRLQHARKGGNMSGRHMLKKAAICLAAACLKRRQHVRLQHVQTGCNNMMYFFTTGHFYSLLNGQ
jgi:UPF0716 family protein affecting phage T7 exclusion